jgi:O-antigen ligase
LLNTFSNLKINNYINFGFIALMFLFPFDKGLMNWFPPLILLLWIVEGNFKSKWNILKNCKIFWLLISMIVLMLISTIFSSSYSNGLYPKEFVNSFDFIIRRYLLLFILIPIMITNLKEETINRMIYAFLLAMFISEIKSYAIFFQLIDGKHNDPTPFLSHSFYTPFLVITIFLLIDRIYKSNNIYMKIGYGIFTLTATTNLFVNGGRIGQLIFLFVLLFYFFYKYRNLKIIIATIIVIPIIYSLAYNFSPVFHKRANTTIFTASNMLSSKNYYKSSFGQRVTMWKISLESFKHFSFKTYLLGVGFGDSRAVYFENLNKHIYPVAGYPIRAKHLHNQFIMFLFDGGFILLSLYLYLFYLLFTTNFYEYDLEEKIFAITLFFLSFTEDPLFRAYGVLFFVLFTGMFFSYKKQYEIK